MFEQSSGKLILLVVGLYDHILIYCVPMGFFLGENLSINHAYVHMCLLSVVRQVVACRGFYLRTEFLVHMSIIDPWLTKVASDQSNVTKVANRLKLTQNTFS